MLQLLLFSLIASIQAEIRIGDLTNYYPYSYKTGGEVLVRDEKTIIVRGFTFDGNAPSTVFLTGKSGECGFGQTILPYPFDGKFYDFNSKLVPVLDRDFNGTNPDEIVLTLPDNLKTTDLKFLCVYCRQFSLNFGDVQFGENLDLKPRPTIAIEKPEEILQETESFDDSKYEKIATFGEFYKFKGAMTFEQGKTACNDIGGQLLEFNENRNYRVKLRALKEKFGSEKTKLSVHGYTEYFSDILSYIGVSDQEYEGSWKWLSGRRLYSWWPAMINFFFGREGPWAYHEPDNYSNKEHCGMMYHDLHMADTDCTNPLPIICEKV